MTREDHMLPVPFTLREAKADFVCLPRGGLVVSGETCAGHAIAVHKVPNDLLSDAIRPCLDCRWGRMRGMALRNFDEPAHRAQCASCAVLAPAGRKVKLPYFCADCAPDQEDKPPMPDEEKTPRPRCVDCDKPAGRQPKAGWATPYRCRACRGATTGRPKKKARKTVKTTPKINPMPDLGDQAGPATPDPGQPSRPESVPDRPAAVRRQMLPGGPGETYAVQGRFVAGVASLGVSLQRTTSGIVLAVDASEGLHVYADDEDIQRLARAGALGELVDVEVTIRAHRRSN